MDFESVADAHRYLSNQVAECVYNSIMLFVAVPTPVAPKDIIAALAKTVEAVTETLHMLAVLEPGSQKLECALARAAVLTEALRVKIDGSATITLEAPLADFFGCFDLHPTFPELLQETRSRAGTSRT